MFGGANIWVINLFNGLSQTEGSRLQREMKAYMSAIKGDKTHDVVYDQYLCDMYHTQFELWVVSLNLDR